MRHIPLRRYLMMAGGILIMGFGIALFQVSAFGTDPNTAFGLAVAGRLGVGYPPVSIAINCVYFLAMLLWGRHRIGAGTFVNWLGVGPLVTLFAGLIGPVWGTRPLPARLALMAVGVVVLSFSVSLYQTAALGTSPYDSLSLMLAQRTPVPYFWCRIFTDSVSTAAAFSLGGVVGIGTLVTALGTGPFVTFFDTHVSRKLLREP